MNEVVRELRAREGQKPPFDGGAIHELLGLVAAGTLSNKLAKDVLAIIATAAAKGGEPGIAATASALGVPLVLVPPTDLEAAGARTITRSERVVALMGVPSVAEASALAACGTTARLLGPRIALGPATCALAATGGTP